MFNNVQKRFDKLKKCELIYSSTITLDTIAAFETVLNDVLPQNDDEKKMYDLVAYLNTHADLETIICSNEELHFLSAWCNWRYVCKIFNLWNVVFFEFKDMRYTLSPYVNKKIKLTEIVQIVDKAKLKFAVTLDKNCLVTTPKVTQS